MRVKKILAFLLAVSCGAAMFAGCGNGNGAASSEAADSASSVSENTSSSSEGEHETITIQSPFRDLSAFLEVLKEEHPEINLEVMPYSGANTTAYLQAELHADDMPDIYTTTVYTPGLEDLSDRLMDLSGYDFTNNFSEPRLKDVLDNGALYLLPINYTCFGITYNKTLLEENGWELPTTFKELEELAPKIEAAGYKLALDQMALPGYGFQYICNILDTGFLNTISGRKWQHDFLEGNTSVKDSPEMTEAFSLLEMYKEIGMLNGDGDWVSDTETKNRMADGEAIFMLGAMNNYTDKNNNGYEFGLMPYLSIDGTQNALILNVSRYIGLNKHLEDPGNEQKLEDAIHVMDVVSTVEGLNAMNKNLDNSTLLPLSNYVIPETNYYKQVEEELNAGLTAPFIYSGWDNLIVPIGNAGIEYLKGNITIEELMDAFDDNQHLLFDNTAQQYTNLTEKLDTVDAAKLVGIALGKGCGADLSLISINKWYINDVETPNDLNTDGVSGALFAGPITAQELTSILPTGWHGDIWTVTLTGKRIREIAEAGYEKNQHIYPYELVMPEGMELEDDKTYTAVICGVSDEVAEEGDLTDTGVVGLDVMEEYLSSFETYSKDDLRWE